MNIRFFLSEASGSNEADIEYIERAIVKKQPFGLDCGRSKVLFIPATFKAYWLWSDNSRGPTFAANSLDEFVIVVKMQYLSHKTLITTDGVLAITSILDYERKQRELAVIRRANVSQPIQPPRPVAASAGRVFKSWAKRRKPLPELAGSATEPILLPESIRDAKDLPGDRGKDAAGDGG